MILMRHRFPSSNEEDGLPRSAAKDLVADLPGCDMMRGQKVYLSGGHEIAEPRGSFLP
jgi:hypothetical protein